jgi:hypothetical protein
MGHNEAMKVRPEYVEGPEAWKRFAGAMGKVIKVSHSEIQQRIEAERQASLANPKRRGPKRKTRAES